MLAAPVALWLQSSALAQPTGGTNTPPPPAQNAGAATPAVQDNVEFFFPGGTPGDFLNAVEKQYKVDWKKVADIPENMRFVRIPALRMNHQSADSMFAAARRGGGGGGGGLGLAALDHAVTRPNGFSNLLAKTIAESVSAASTGASNNISEAHKLSPPTEAEREAYYQARQRLADLQAEGALLQRRYVTNHPKFKANLLAIEGAEATKKALEDANPSLLAAAPAEERNPLEALVALYNSLQQARPELGNLLVEGDLARPSVVLFHSGAANRTSDVKMKTFALKGIPVNEWGKLEGELNEQFKMLDYLNHLTGPLGAQALIHKDTALLFVFSPESSYLEAAESLIAAWNANHPTPASEVLK